MSFGLSVKKEVLSHCACVKWTAMVQFASVRDTRRRGSMNVAIRSPAHFYLEKRFVSESDQTLSIKQK